MWPEAIYPQGDFGKSLRLDGCSNLNDIRRIAAAKARSQQALMEYLQLRQSMNTKTSKKGLHTFLLCDTSDAPLTGSTLHKEQDPEFHMHLLNNMEAILKIEKKVLLLGRLCIADDLSKSLQQKALTGRKLHQGQQQIFVVSV